MKLCECGCGKPAPIATQTNTKLGVRQGHPQRFVKGHATRTMLGERSSRWNGGKLTRYGRIFRFIGKGEPMADVNGYAAEHRLVFAKAIGRPLTKAEQVHHMDFNPANNDIANLLILTRSTHRRLHGFLNRGSSHEEAMREICGVGVRV